MAPLNLYRGFFFFALGGLLFGYSIGVTGGILKPGQLRCCRAIDAGTCAVTEQAGASVWEVGYDLCYDFNSLELGVMSSFTMIGTMLGCLLSFRFAEAIGRKREAMCGALMYGVGSMLCAFAPNLFILLLGLLVFGIGVGFAMHAAPLYIAETTPASKRGTFVGAKEAMIVLGIFLGFASNLALGELNQGWRYMLGVVTLLAAAMGGGISFLPRSPRWLALQAQAQTDDLLGTKRAALQQEALEAVRFFRTGDTDQCVRAEVTCILEDVQAAAQGPQNVTWTAAFAFPKPLAIGCGIVFLQQVTGQPSVLYFSDSIFKAAGFGNVAALSSTGVGAVKLIATLVTVWRVDDYGRRPLLLIGISTMLVALIIVALGFLNRECKTGPIETCALDDITLPTGWAYAVVGALMAYVSGYQIGFGPIAWLLISEVFPLNVRGAAMSIAVMVNFGSNVLVTATLDTMLSALTPPGVFFLYAVMSLISLLFVYFGIPETRGKTLEEIEAQLTGRKATLRQRELECA